MPNVFAKNDVSVIDALAKCSNDLTCDQIFKSGKSRKYYKCREASEIKDSQSDSILYLKGIKYLIKENKKKSLMTINVGVFSLISLILHFRWIHQASKTILYRQKVYKVSDIERGKNGLSSRYRMFNRL